MYYKSDPTASPTAKLSNVSGLPMTPSVALRSLESQLTTFASGPGAVFAHFVGPITPPKRGVRRPVGDPVFNAISVYTSKVLGQHGLLSSHAHPYYEIDITDQLTREMFAFQHSLALDLGRHHPEMPIAEREMRAQAVLALAAFWCDRKELLEIEDPKTHQLLGRRPEDNCGFVLYDLAKNAVQRAF